MLLFEVLDHRPSITFKKSRRVQSVRPPKQVKERDRKMEGEERRKERKGEWKRRKEGAEGVVR